MLVGPAQVNLTLKYWLLLSKGWRFKLLQLLTSKNTVINAIESSRVMCPKDPGSPWEMHQNSEMGVLRLARSYAKDIKL